MEAAYRYVLEKINMGMTIKGMYRQDVYELPTDSIREIIPFPMNKNAQDVMMGAPAEVDEKQLREVHIKISAPEKQ